MSWSIRVRLASQFIRLQHSKCLSGSSRAWFTTVQRLPMVHDCPASTHGSIQLTCHQQKPKPSADIALWVTESNSLLRQVIQVTTSSHTAYYYVKSYSLLRQIIQVTTSSHTGYYVKSYRLLRQVIQVTTSSHTGYYVKSYRLLRQVIQVTTSSHTGYYVKSYR